MNHPKGQVQPGLEQGQDMPQRTRVSVIIRTYNRLSYAVEAIDSALNQTYKECEIILVDVGSTNDPRAFLERKYGTKIRCFRYPDRNHFKALNFAIRQSKGDILLFLDDDDLLLETNIEKQLNILIKYPEISVVFSRYAVFHDHNKDRIVSESSWVNPDDLSDEMLKHNTLPFTGVMVRKVCVEKIGGVDESLISCVDHDLWLRLLLTGHQFHCINEVLTLRREHDTNVTRKKSHILRGVLQILEKLRGGLIPEGSTKRPLLLMSMATYQLRLGVVLLEEGYYREGRARIFRSILMNVPGKKWALLYLGLSIMLSKKGIDRVLESVFLRRFMEFGPITWGKAREQ